MLERRSCLLLKRVSASRCVTGHSAASSSLSSCCSPHELQIPRSARLMERRSAIKAQIKVHCCEQLCVCVQVLQHIQLAIEHSQMQQRAALCMPEGQVCASFMQRLQSCHCSVSRSNCSSCVACLPYENVAAQSSSGNSNLFAIECSSCVPCAIVAVIKQQQHSQAEAHIGILQ